VFTKILNYAPLSLALLGLIFFASPRQSLESAESQSISNRYTTVDEFAHSKFSVNGEALFRNQSLPGVSLDVSEKKLLKVLISTRTYFTNFAAVDPVVNRQGVLATQGVTVDKVLKTLDFMIQILQEDIGSGRVTRLRDPQFINQNFRVIRWLPYNPRAGQQTQNLRMTKYAVFIHEGSRRRTSKFNTALYALPEKESPDLFHKRFTKQQVLAGIYEPGGKLFGKVEPLAYLTRASFEDALMQGTILIKFGGGSSAYFNVDRNNGIAYIKDLDPMAQRRYWYFQQVTSIKGYGNKIENKIAIEPSVTFAGDVFNIGLGKIVVIDTGSPGQKRLVMGIIADTGGAFIPNLYQLDYLAGIFPNRQDFAKRTGYMPDSAKAYFLVKK
jgi:hypothetical protein